MVLSFKILSALYIGIRYRKLKHVKGIACSICLMSWCDLDLIFDPAVVNLTFKTCLGYISDTVRCKKLLKILIGACV